ncbi:DNA mismatch repair protein MutL [Alicyclobacillus contaminans]|nr:DNA mismatch repair protein MutL [Alicyclobacillus contaminans]
MPPGTRIEVRDLFFNTPARLKYLKSVQTEQSRCLDVIHRAALARPDVGFRCAIDDHVVFQTTGNGSVRDVLAALYSVGEAKQFLPVTADTADYRLHGWIGRPTQAKSSRSHTYLYINQRPIRNPAVHQAVVAGYGNRLMVGKHPMYALYLEMDPGLVDVNIHPHKAEVRFSEERDVVQMVQRAVQSVLDTTFLVPGVSFSGTPASDRRVVSGQQAKLELATTAEPAAPYQPGTGYPTSAGSRVLTASPGKREGSVPTVSRTPKQPVDWQQWMPLQSSPPEPSHTDVPVADEPAAPDADRAAEERPSNWRLRPVGQALGMYMIAEDGQDLYVIDQHAAHERVLYERFSQRMRAAEVPAIALVTPLNLTLSGAQWDAVQTHRELLAEMGLSLEAFGGRDVVVRTIPTIWEGLDYGQLVEEFLETLAASARLSNVRDVLRDQIVMRACKAAIKANDFLHPLEMEALCEALSTLEDPFHCPHGRPVFLRLTAQQLEKEFRRIV